ncbi:MAG: cytochrome-c oxidase [Microcystis sp. 53598_E5]|uniref:cytochrome-c oxidase n=1 Tax=Microcystis sp. M53598_WE2 TaxID=3030677 RepID=UPI002586B650|nr:cytochrome-c oxidase [Microcystis sp. M53598_WE2]MCE2673654.1 cytochrome-c oxidase [Microcystis sp. 53598_E5]MDJ0673588.1 cytochrome-c oxidase [Microcystis sp. M53598_WE2]
MEEILSAKIGSFAAKIVQALADDEGKVEEVLIKELQANFQERGIKANLFSVTGLDMLGNGRLEVNVNVRSANMMS